MKLSELNDNILNRYSELIEEHDLTTEEVVKSSACLTIKLFEVIGVENVEIDGKRLSLEDI